MNLLSLRLVPEADARQTEQWVALLCLQGSHGLEL